MGGVDSELGGRPGLGLPAAKPCNRPDLTGPTIRRQEDLMLQNCLYLAGMIAASACRGDAAGRALAAPCCAVRCRDADRAHPALRISWPTRIYDLRSKRPDMIEG